MLEKEIGNTFGKFINHSSIHANIGTKVLVIDKGKLDVLFYSLRKIKVGEQLLWDYGRIFDGFSNCVKDCFQCLKQSKLRFDTWIIFFFLKEEMLKKVKLDITSYPWLALLVEPDHGIWVLLQTTGD